MSPNGVTGPDNEVLGAEGWAMYGTRHTTVTARFKKGCSYFGTFFTITLHDPFWFSIVRGVPAIR